MRAALADDFCDLVMRVVEIVGERLIAHRLLDRIEVGALHVLDDGKLERLAVADFDRHDRNVVEPCALRRAPAPLAGDRKSTRLNSSHQIISYAVFCLKKKKKKITA